MIPTDFEDFLRGYADAEESLLDADFNLAERFDFFVKNPPKERYEEGYRLRLEEEMESWRERLNILFGRK